MNWLSEVTRCSFAEFNACNAYNNRTTTQILRRGIARDKAPLLRSKEGFRFNQRSKQIGV